MNRSLQQFMNSYHHLFEVAARYPADRAERPGACGEWSAKQVLAHCSGWIAEALRRYEMYDRGENSGVRYDFDGFNAQSVADRAGLTWDETVGELYGLVDVYRFRIARLKPEVIAANRRYMAWVDSLADDCANHTVQLEQFLEQA